MHYLIYLAFICVFAGLDQFVKYMIVNNFSLYESKAIINNFFNITYIRNYGAGFSIFQNETIFLVIISIIAIILLGYLIIKSKKEESIYRFSYLLILSGALGNLIDRIRLTYVVDFLDFNILGYDFPIFNVADCFITIGCFLLIILIVKEGKNANN